MANKVSPNWFQPTLKALSLHSSRAAPAVATRVHTCMLPARAHARRAPIWFLHMCDYLQSVSALGRRHFPHFLNSSYTGFLSFSLCGQRLQGTVKTLIGSLCSCLKGGGAEMTPSLSGGGDHPSLASAFSPAVQCACRRMAWSDIPCCVLNTLEGSCLVTPRATKLCP